MPETSVVAPRMRRSGNSWVIPLSKSVREKMQLQPGDCVLLRVTQDGVLIGRRATPQMIYDRQRQAAAPPPPAAAGS